MPQRGPTALHRRQDGAGAPGWPDRWSRRLLTLSSVTLSPMFSVEITFKKKEGKMG